MTTHQDPPPLSKGPQAGSGPDGSAEPQIEGPAATDSLAFESVQRRPRRRRKGYSWVILFIVIIASAGAGWVYWNTHAGNGQTDSVPLVTAEVSPVKVKPEQPGGLDFPNQDKLVYERLESTPPPQRTENLLPRPEAPMPPPVSPPTQTAEAPEPIDTQPASGPATAEVTAAPAVSAKTVPTTEHPTPEEVIEAKKPAPPPPPPAQEVARRTDATAPVGGAYRVQLASIRSEDAVRAEWGRLKGKYPDMLGGLDLTVARADLGAKGIFYRLRAGPLSESAAKKLCADLAKNKVGCLVVRPGT